MALLQPNTVYRRITCITPEELKSRGICALILDVDNTLTAHGSQAVPQDVAQWLENMRSSGIRLRIASNNMPARVRPFAQRIGIGCSAVCCKPLPFGIARARRAMKARKAETALIGDQIFTDVLGANLYGIPALMVLPMAQDTNRMICLKRRLEKPILARYYKKGGTVHGAEWPDA